MSPNDGIEPVDDIKKMEELSIKILSYELNNRNNNSSLTSVMEKTQEQSEAGQKQKNDMSNTLFLFRKYLHDKARQAWELVNAEQSETASANFQTKPYKNLLPPPRGASLSSRPTLLEKEFLPRARQSSTLASNTSSPKGQLTILYSGAVNVYDTVPADKAQAIMLLASESSLLDPFSPSTPTISADPPKYTNCLLTKMQADLPISRKVSFRLFLDKRRDRIATSSPYSIEKLKQDAEKSLAYYG